MASSAQLEDVHVYSDSLVVVNQVNGIWRCKSEELLPFYLSVKIIQRELRFSLIHVPRHLVWLPDKLCNVALNYMADFKSKMPTEYDDYLVTRSMDDL